MTTVQAAVLSVTAAALAQGQPMAAADGETFPISGVAMQMTQLDGRYFEHAGSDIKGLSFPITLLCPGGLAVVAGGMTCTESPNDGLQGVIVAIENVVRHDVGLTRTAPWFEMEGQQMFSGWVARNGVRYYGTLTLFMEFTGKLNEPPGVDCFNEPQNLACGAADFNGTWKVLAGQGTGRLGSVQGNGTIAWAGCRVPGDYSTCSVPEFSGTLSFGKGAIRR
ncbi:MAG: hypothetical protein A2177_08570 [Spirochaetes bacterium RBG_13_68_11]|nr:MAG: hypothetical protein A2177_08570 [Spirochaetes bacterium RBG_13_68_11]